ncbi:hypothetical protein [Lonepinella sp. BR2474]|uniref:hypothetical protein n=1 Tax=Lonepinella sp. BR2474 TaxID=3434548 RepID=UPI003F6E1499
MSHSYRKHKFFGYGGGDTDQAFKQRFNRSFRRISKQHIESDREPLHSMHEVGPPWESTKIAKHYWAGASERDMRK